MFEPIRGNCFHCGAEATFPCNWKNDWFICDKCLAKVLPELKRKKPEGLVLKNKKKLEYYTLWKPFKKMPLETIRDTLEFVEENEKLAADFHPAKILCGGNFEVDEEKQQFRVVRNTTGQYSPVFSLSEVTDYYVQTHYQKELDILGDLTGKSEGDEKFFEGAEISIELSNPYVPFVDLYFLNEKPSFKLFGGDKELRRKAEEELSGVLKRKIGETRTLTDSAVSDFEDMLEGNPYTVSQNMKNGMDQ